MKKYSRVFRRAAAVPGYPRKSCFFYWSLAVFILRDARQPCSNRKFPALMVLSKSQLAAGPTPQPALLNNDLLLLRVHPALRRLGRYRDYGLSGRQRRREVMEPAVRVYHRNFTAIYHDPRPGLGLACPFNYMAVLNEGIQFKSDRLSLLAFGNDREAVLLTLHRLFPRRVIGLDHPVISAFSQARDGYRSCINFLINECRRKIGIAGDAQTVTNCIRHRCPGK